MLSSRSNSYAATTQTWIANDRRIAFNIPATISLQPRLSLSSLGRAFLGRGFSMLEPSYDTTNPEHCRRGAL